VMSPYQKSQNSNGTHGIYHTNISKYWFTSKKTLHMTYNTKCRLNQYINLRMTKEPELMLIQYYVTSSSRQEKTCIKVSISQKHSLTCSKYRKTTNQQNTYKTLCPNKQGQTVKCHSLGTHICYCYLEINGSLNTSYPCYVQTKNCLVYRSSRVAQSTTKRRICCPTYSSTLFNQSTQLQLNHSHRQNPKRNIVHTRESHIGCSDHYGYLPISESSHQSRHYYKE
jgi:hypothetical protein